jgi:hypothetical protein
MVWPITGSESYVGETGQVNESGGVGEHQYEDAAASCC